ncbi:MAG: ribosomal-processing cysteine protease Prp [Peptostreptococcaceae bacterium]|nr:ribosomal-processing cysteine protease Prp [Peptostreptococcaceae bacterium]
MITVTTTSDFDGNLYKVEVEGHAGQAEYGEDIVCSAVSILATTTLNGLIDVVKTEVDYMIEDGYMKFEVDKNKMNHSIKVLLDTFEIGIRSMLEDYGQYVRLVKKEVQPNDKS